jgi:anti-anti-sigma regulatory factor
VTTPKSSKKRKSSTRVRPKRAAVSATKAVPAAVPTVGPALSPDLSPSAVPAVSAAAEPNGVTAVMAATVPRTDDGASAGICVQLEPGLEIKDAEGVHRLLMAALGDGRAVTVDVGRVHAVDTAGAQLLLAFQSEASRRGVTIEFRGESALLSHTLAVLGLRDKFPFAVPHG